MVTKEEIAARRALIYYPRVNLYSKVPTGYSFWKKKPSNPLISHLWARTYDHNQNALILNHGPPGSGKSESSLGLGTLTDPNFNIENVVFSTQDFVHLVRGKGVKRGSYIMYEEVGVGANSRNFYTQENKQLSFLTQTFRTMNLICVYTVPERDFVDRQLRPLFHYDMCPISIDRERSMNVVKFENLRFNMRQNDWIHWPVTFYERNRSIKIRGVKIPRAPQSLISEYNSKRQEFLDRLGEQAENVLGDKGGEKVKENKTWKYQEQIDRVVSNYEKYIIEGKMGKRLNGSLIAIDLKMSSGGNLAMIKAGATDKLKAIGVL
jgi:hypothetical protein